MVHDGLKIIGYALSSFIGTMGLLLVVANNVANPVGTIVGLMMLAFGLWMWRDHTKSMKEMDEIERMHRALEKEMEDLLKEMLAEIPNKKGDMQ